MLFRDRDDLVERGLLPDRTAADIGGLLDADHRLWRLVARARVQRSAKGLRRELAVGALQLRDLEAADRGMRAALPRGGIGALLGGGFLARAGKDPRFGGLCQPA